MAVKRNAQAGEIIRLTGEHPAGPAETFQVQWEGGRVSRENEFSVVPGSWADELSYVDARVVLDLDAIV